MKRYLSKVDTATTGGRYDVTPLFADPQAFDALVTDLAAPFEASAPDFVACLDALGFILGTALARHLGAGVLPVRKGHKLPTATDFETCVDYSGTQKRLEIRKDILHPGAKVLLVDDWVETGAQAAAAIRLIERQGAVVVGIAAVCIDETDKTLPLRQKYTVRSVWEPS